jgi:hypothetical protein
MLYYTGMFYKLRTLLPEMISYVFVIKSVPINMDYIYAAMYVFYIPWTHSWERHVTTHGFCYMLRDFEQAHWHAGVVSALQVHL